MADDSQTRLDPERRDIAALTTRVLAAWRRRLRRLGDAHPRAGDRGESERHLVAALLRVAEADDEQVLASLAAAAAHYGSEQPRARLDPAGLCNEFGKLRQIILRQLNDRHSMNSEATAACVHRIDQAITIVAKAAVSADYTPPAADGDPRRADRRT